MYVMQQWMQVLYMLPPKSKTAFFASINISEITKSLTSTVAMMRGSILSKFDLCPGLFLSEGR